MAPASDLTKDGEALSPPRRPAPPPAPATVGVAAPAGPGLGAAPGQQQTAPAQPQPAPATPAQTTHAHVCKGVNSEQQQRSVVVGGGGPLSATAPLLVATVGLPARSKTTLAHRLARFLAWNGELAEAFTVSDYRRKLMERYDNHNLFRADNSAALEIRNKSAALALADAIEWLRSSGTVAVLDGTHATRAARRQLKERVADRLGWRLLFVECVVDDDAVLERNIQEILHNSPDYRDMGREKAEDDFRKKIAHYLEQYEPVAAKSEGISVVRYCNDGESVTAHRLSGHLEAQVLSFLASFRPCPKTLYFSRHGESEYNVLGRIGGDANLSPRGQEEGDPASPGQPRPGPALPAAPEPAAAPPASPDMDDASSRRQATRVFKKSSPNGKITVYLGKRDFVDHITHVDPIDGVVLIDPEYVKDRKVFGHVLAAFRYGREDLDVLGLTFRKDLYLAAEQIFPLIQPEGGAAKRPLTRLQERLIKKLGPNAYPFYFELPPHCPASVTLQPAPGDTGKPCGVDYELKAFVGETQEDKPHKRNSVRLAIRKIMYAPSKQGEQPSVEVSKEFMMSPNKLHLEASLDKELYHHGENIAVNVHIANNSNRTVKKIKVSVRQFADICLFSTAQYKCTVAETESEEGCPIGPGFTLSKVFVMTPLLANNKDKWGLALDGQLKHEDTNLASSTLVADPSQRENLGIIVQYKVKVKLCLGALGGDLAAELPFILMHPKPEEEPPLPPTARPSPSHAPSLGGADDTAMDTNLIQLDTDGILPDQDDDIIFEDFARLRLKGETDA